MSSCEQTSALVFSNRLCSRRKNNLVLGGRNNERKRNILFKLVANARNVWREGTLLSNEIHARYFCKQEQLLSRMAILQNHAVIALSS